MDIRALILIVAFFLFFSGYLNYSSILSGNGITNEVRNEFWNGYPVELQSSYFGSTSSGASVKVSSNPLIWKHFDFCGDNDGSHLISNSFDLSNTLRLKSSMGSSKCCNDFNYISAKVKLPKGTIKAVCSLDSQDAYNEGWAECSVGNVVKRVDARSGSLVQKFEFILDSEKEVNIYVRTFTGCKLASSSGELSLQFEPSLNKINNPLPVVNGDIDLSFFDKIKSWIFGLFSWIGN